MRVLNIISRLFFLFVAMQPAFSQFNDNERVAVVNEANQMLENDQKYRLMIMYGETNVKKLDSLINLPFEKRILILKNRYTDKYTLSEREVDSLFQLQFLNDSLNFIKLKAIIDKYGWINTNDTIKNALTAILLHTKEKQLLSIKPLLLREVDNKRMDPKDYASIWDRMLIENGELQLYGTISTWNYETNSEDYPIIKDIDQSNLEREKIGLGKLKQYQIYTKSGN